MDGEAGLRILEDSPLEGTAAAVERLQGADDDEAAEALQEFLDQQEVGRPGDRGWLRDLVAHFRSLEQVADHGTHPVKVEWLAFHVPPGGSGQLVFTSTGTQESSVKLGFAGLGGGSGRSLTLEDERDLGTRQQCFALGYWLDVRVQTFRSRDEGEELRVDVTAVTSSYLDPMDPCPLCFTDPGRRPARAQPAGFGWDLSSDEQGVTERKTIDIAGSSEVDVTLAIPGLALDGLVPGVAVRRKVGTRCEAVYTFPGRASFVAYELVGRRKDYPFWGRS